MAQSIIEAVIQGAPPPSATAPAAAAACFDEAVRVWVLLRGRLDSHNLAFAAPLADMLRVATSSPGTAGPLQCGKLLDWVLAEHTAGRWLKGEMGKAMLDITLRLLHFGHRCGLDTPDAVAQA